MVRKEEPRAGHEPREDDMTRMRRQKFSRQKELIMSYQQPVESFSRGLSIKECFSVQVGNMYLIIV